MDGACARVGMCWCMCVSHGISEGSSHAASAEQAMQSDRSFDAHRCRVPAYLTVRSSAPQAAQSKTAWGDGVEALGGADGEPALAAAPPPLRTPQSGGPKFVSLLSRMFGSSGKSYRVADAPRPDAANATPTREPNRGEAAAAASESTLVRPFSPEDDGDRSPGSGANNMVVADADDPDGGSAKPTRKLDAGYVIISNRWDRGSRKQMKNVKSSIDTGRPAKGKGKKKR